MALAAGHRPCALCRHADYVRWLDSWEAAHGERLRADPMDRRMHADRLDGRAPAPAPAAVARLARRGVRGDPEGGEPALVLGDRLAPWSPAGYGRALDRPERGDATVLTPACTVDVLAHGYAPALHPAAGVPG